MGAQDDQRVNDDLMLKLHCGAAMAKDRSQGLCALAMDHVEEEHEERAESSSSSRSVGTSCSIGSSEMEEDDASSSSSSKSKYSSSNSSSSGSLSNNGQGPLYELSELMSQLPMKRGLSEFYGGRSQSYTSLASVKSVEDLQKKEIISSSYSSCKKRLKLCKSYGGGLDKSAAAAISPKAVISKKAPQHTASSLARRSSLGMANNNTHRPPVPVLRT